MPEPDHSEKSLHFRMNIVTGIVYLTYERNPTLVEWLQTIDEIVSNPGFKPHFSFLSDRRKVDASKREFLQTAIEYLEHCRRVGRWKGYWAVVIGNAASLGMANLAKSLLEPAVYKVFVDFDEAQSWLLNFGQNNQPQIQI